MSRHIGKQADRRVPIAIGVLAVVLGLLGAQQAFGPAVPAAGQPVQMASAMTAPAAR
jgi:hypothetical protein